MKHSSRTGGLAIARVLLSVSAIALVALTVWLLSPGKSGSTEASVIALGPVRQVVNEVIAAPVAAAATGTFKGTIKFKGAAPVRPPLYAKGAAPKDPAVCGLAEIPDESLVVNAKNNGISHVFVYLQKPPAGYKAPPPPKGLINFDQKNCIFVPHMLLVRTGQQVNLMNGDPIAHNTHTYPNRNNGFNQAIGPNVRQGVVLTYKRPEKLPVKVACDFHPWMQAHHLVLDHPFMAVTDEDGKFEIKDLPAGKHEFTIWQERSGYLDKTLSVEVPAGEAKESTLEYGADKLSAFNGPQPKQVLVSFSE